MASPRFDARWQRKRRWKGRWNAVRPWLVLGVILAAGWWLSRNMQPPLDPLALPRQFTICGERASNACVIDGDTIALGPPPGSGKPSRRIRFTGYDAPELGGACQAERTAAIRARGALYTWLNTSPAQVDGGLEPPRDKYGRELRRAFRSPGAPETDLADTMLAKGLASESGWGTQPIDWCAER